ncbi:YerC/YecD family TrpR-related protein [Candidatus Paracaedibacter symbiosus]|uniref:YerC/YecD family TrpR-related protein n=1 Tax=Candidatus Paracaedibacter symbiosus TaxID=244582 RepID=UPI000509E3EB|nr:YerC/YecD family TrpR-related protein [Candidatus Paracaedibacter symbiosus]
MEDDHHHIKPIELAEALFLLETEDEVHRFLKDLCTPQEIIALKERWRVCQYLEAGNLSYRDIHRLTGASLTTIGRVARFLKEEPYQGYRLVLNRINKKNGTS